MVRINCRVARAGIVGVASASLSSCSASAELREPSLLGSRPPSPRREERGPRGPAALRHLHHSWDSLWNSMLAGDYCHLLAARRRRILLREELADPSSTPPPLLGATEARLHQAVLLRWAGAATLHSSGLIGLIAQLLERSGGMKQPRRVPVPFSGCFGMFLKQRVAANGVTLTGLPPL